MTIQRLFANQGCHTFLISRSERTERSYLHGADSRTGELQLTDLREDMLDLRDQFLHVDGYRQPSTQEGRTMGLLTRHDSMEMMCWHGHRTTVLPIRVWLQSWSHAHWPSLTAVYDYMPMFDLTRLIWMTVYGSKEGLKYRHSPPGATNQAAPSHTARRGKQHSNSFTHI